MNMSESDGIEEALEGQLRVLVTAATQLGERAARAREAAQRTAAAHSEQEQRELQARFAAEQQLARTQYGQVHNPQWWDNAKPEDISAVWQTTKAWSAEDPEAARAEARMAQEINDRYGITPEELHTAADAERTRAAKDRAEAEQLMQQADHQDRAQDKARNDEPSTGLENTRSGRDIEAETQVLYDSAERREGTARDLESQGIDPAVVKTRMRADISQGKPATEAVTSKPRSAKARKTRGSAGIGAERQGLAR